MQFEIETYAYFKFALLRSALLFLYVRTYPLLRSLISRLSITLNVYIQFYLEFYQTKDFTETMLLQVRNNSRVNFMTKFHQTSFSIISKGNEKGQITGIIPSKQGFIICKMYRIRATDLDESFPGIAEVNNEWS
jgi:hypothetical protein